MKDSSFPKPFQRGRFPYSYYWIILFGLLYVLNREAINLGLVKKKLRITIILKVITRQLYFFIIIFVVFTILWKTKQAAFLLVGFMLITYGRDYACRIGLEIAGDFCYILRFSWATRVHKRRSFIKVYVALLSELSRRRSYQQLNTLILVSFVCIKRIHLTC